MPFGSDPLISGGSSLWLLDQTFIPHAERRTGYKCLDVRGIKMKSNNTKYIHSSLLTVTALLLSFPIMAAEQEDVQNFFSKNKVGNSPDYAFVKNGIAGPDHLLTIHGYANDKAVCETLAREYNGDSSLSVVQGVYQCIPLNK